MKVAGPAALPGRQEAELRQPRARSTALEGTALAEILRVSRCDYAVVNALHIFGIALLIGATLPLDLRLLGARRSVPRKVLVRVLAPVAAGGLCIAVLAGLWLFSIRAREYAGIGFPQTKLTLVAIGTVSALALRWSHGLLLKTANWPRLAIHAVVSLICWIGALVCGRLIAFAGE